MINEKLYYWLIQKFHIKLVLKTIFVEAVTVISKQNNWPLLWKCVRVGLGPWGRLRALDQSCDSPSRLGVKAIAHVHLHLDKRHIREDLLKTFSIHNVQSTFQLFSFVNWKVVIISESMSQKNLLFYRMASYFGHYNGYHNYDRQNLDFIIKSKIKPILYFD